MKNRVIALLLSAAMVVTMVPGNCVLVKAEEVPEVAVTEINADQEEAPDQEQIKMIRITADAFWSPLANARNSFRQANIL